MCARYTLTKKDKELAEAYAARVIDLTNQHYPADMMHAYRVSKAVNITRGGNNKGLELILPENSK